MTVANASALLRSGTSSPTTLVAAFSGGTTLTYTPTSPVEVTINVGNLATGVGSGSFLVNGIQVFQTSTSANAYTGSQSITFQAGAGQTLTFNSTSIAALISARKID